MKFVRKIYLVLLAGLILLTGVPVVFAQGITIDGAFADWAGKAAVADSGGADDERAPSRADINEFRADADSGGLYLLKTWDNTTFTGGQETTAGITIQTAAGAYYRVYTTAQAKSDPPVQLASLQIKSCTDATCAKQNDVCNGSGCSDAQADSGTTWNDYFADIRKQAPDCSGNSCGKYDTAVEIYVPWNLVGGAPESGQAIFLYFGSYPSGPAQAPKDDAGEGIACQSDKGTWRCYPIHPTAVTFSSFSANSAPSALDLERWTPSLLIGVIIASGTIFWRFRKRQT